MDEKTIKHTMNEVEIPAGAEVDVDVDLEASACGLSLGGLRSGWTED